MEVIITEWALDTYLQLKHQNIITPQLYKTVIRPDVELLLDYKEPGESPKFSTANFWGPVTAGGSVSSAYKMKWHNFGSGRVQLRLLCYVHDGEVYLCKGYVKSNDRVDRRMMVQMLDHIELIEEGKANEEGRITK